MRIAKTAFQVVSLAVCLAPTEYKLGWAPTAVDPTAPLVRSVAGRQDARRFRDAQTPLRPYRFGDASYLQFREYLQQAGPLPAATSEDAVPDTDGQRGGAVSGDTHR